MSDRFAGGIKAGSTSVRMPVILRKTADSTEMTGVAFGSVTATYRREGAASVSIAVVALPTPAITDVYTSGGWIEADATNQPGTYRLDLPNAALATGADWVVVAVKVASAFVFYERFNLESKGVSELSTQVAAGVPLAGVTVAGSTNSSLILSGLPTGRSYVGQRLYHQVSGEARAIAAQTPSGGNYTFTFGTGTGEAGPFSIVPATGDLVYPVA
jgi:hypothetical protein